VSRPRRLELPGVPAHVVQRGNNRSLCFFGDVDRRFYLKLLSHVAAQRGCALHAYVLMSNHVHLLVTPAEAGALSAMLQDLGRRYVRVINEAHGRSGTLWEGRFKSSLIDSDTYLLNCHRYIELNPVRARLVSDPAEYQWSSYRHYAHGAPDRHVIAHRIYTSLAETAPERQAAFAAFCRLRVPGAEIERLRLHLNKGWALGTDDFLVDLQERLGRPVRPPRRGRPPRQKEGPLVSSMRRAEKIL
jgi:putative transposase